MAIAEELRGFVKDGLERGLPRAEIERALLAAGWPPQQAKGALAGFAEIEFPIPVPRPRPYLTAREAFLHLVHFGTLYISAFSLGSLLFQCIDRAFLDPAAPAQVLEGLREATRWSLSYLIVAFPVFLYVARVTGRESRQDPSKRTSKLRRWFMHLTLLVAAGVLAGDVISLVYNLLGGELTVRFLLKVFAIGAIAGTIFGSYVRALRLEEREARA